MEPWLIVNPTAGSLVDPEAVARLRAAAARLGAEVRLTSEHRGAAALAAEALAAGADTVVAAGGDGTVSEVVNGLAAGLDRVRLLIVPGGTANDFAGTLGLPMGDVDAALGLLTTGVERRVDLIHADTNGGRYIINAATGGFSELVHGKLTPEVKQSWGPLAYLRAALDAAPEMCFHDATVDVDGEPVAAQTCALVVANGRSAGGITLAPDAVLDDRRIDVLVITSQTFLEQLRLASRYVVGTHLESPHIVFRRGRRVRVVTRPPMHFSSDGELIGQTPITFAVAPGRLRVIVPG